MNKRHRPHPPSACGQSLFITRLPPTSSLSVSTVFYWPNLCLFRFHYISSLSVIISFLSCFFQCGAVAAFPSFLSFFRRWNSFERFNFLAYRLYQYLSFPFPSFFFSFSTSSFSFPLVSFLSLDLLTDSQDRPPSLIFCAS